MAHRRTREEKIQAKHIYVREIAENEKVRLKMEVVNNTVVSSNFNNPYLVLPTVKLKADLTKTLIVTILALILQFSLASYLQKGGWTQLQLFIEKVF